MSGLEPRYLDVFLHGQKIGWLCEALRVTRFIPDEAFVADPDRPTLSLSITVPGQEEITRSILANGVDPAMYQERGELPPFFAGLLPEGELRNRLAATRKDPRDRDDFGVLAAAGEDLPGAVTVVPADLSKLTAAARSRGVAGGADGLDISVPEKAAQGAASVSGVQNKLALSSAHNGQRFVLPMKGRLSDVIAKLPPPRDDSQVFNEFASMKLAALAGVTTAACRPMPMHAIDMPDLVESLGPETHFLLVDRFDHTPGGVVHSEDACQALTLMPSRKYAGAREFALFVGLLSRLSARGVEDVRQFFIRQAVNALLGNSDAHLKNFSVIYHDGRRPELSPAYDIVCVAALPAFKGYGLNVAIDAAQRSETLSTYREFAGMAGVAPRVAVAAVRTAVELAHETWPAALDKLEVPDAVRAVVLERLASLPLAQLKD